MLHPIIFFSFFFFNDTATTEIYTLSLHDALPIFLLLAEMLHHPNLVRPRGAGRAGPFAYHTRPFVHGTTLRAWIGNNGAVPLTRAVEIVRGVLNGLAHAHAAGIAHGDLKAENILLADEGILVADTGI